MKADVHPRQAERLRALYSYEILDTEREKEFDEVVKLAAEICGTAISVINLIDAERQWFKAEVGLGTRETPLGTSLCSHVILDADFVEINDTLKDPRMADNPLVCGEPGLRFYAGALLKSDGGLPIGTLCVLDWEPRELTPLQRDTLRVLAHQVMAQLDLRRALRTAEALRREVDHRVKNSLQLLSSTTRMQARSATAKETADTLGLIEQRIQTVSMLHEQLYKTTVGAQVDLADYIGNITGFLASIAPDNVTVSATTQPVTVSSAEAASVGMLLNEFCANAFKHAFPDGRAGTIRLDLCQEVDGMVVLRCADDGVGLPDDPGSQTNGLGMKIAAVVSQQLGATLQYDRSGTGAAVRVAFAPGRP